MPGASTEVVPLPASSAEGRLRLGSSSSLPPAPPNDLTTFRKVTFATFATGKVARQH